MPGNDGSRIAGQVGRHLVREACDDDTQSQLEDLILNGFTMKATGNFKEEQMREVLEFAAGLPLDSSLRELIPENFKQLLAAYKAFFPDDWVTVFEYHACPKCGFIFQCEYKALRECPMQGCTGQRFKPTGQPSKRYFCRSLLELHRLIFRNKRFSAAM